MGVAGEVFKDVLRSLNGFPHTDNPGVFVKLLFEVMVFAGNVYFFVAEGPGEVVDKLATKDQGKGLLVKKVVVFAWDPSLGFRTQGSPGNEAVKMKMGLELLIPGMQNAQETYFSSKFPFPKSDQCFRYGFKQDIEHEGFIFQDEGVELMRQGKDAMEIGNGEEL